MFNERENKISQGARVTILVHLPLSSIFIRCFLTSQFLKFPANMTSLVSDASNLKVILLLCVFFSCFLLDIFSPSQFRSVVLARIFHQLLSQDHELNMLRAVWQGYRRRISFCLHYIGGFCFPSSCLHRYILINCS